MIKVTDGAKDKLDKPEFFAAFNKDNLLLWPFLSFTGDLDLDFLEFGASKWIDSSKIFSVNGSSSTFDSSDKLDESSSFALLRTTLVYLWE